MNIALSPALRTFVDAQVKDGRYLDAGDVVREGLRRMELESRRSLAVLGSMGDADIMALAFIVMMEAAKSAREDLKAIMDGVKAINKEKEGWRKVAKAINSLAAAGSCKPDDFDVSLMESVIPRGPVSTLRGKPIGTATLYRNAVYFNAPDSSGATVTGGFVVQGTKGGVTKKDVENAKETIKNTLDSLSEMGEMESLRLQMAMDRLSKLMSTLSNLLKKSSDTASAITQNIK